MNAEKIKELRELVATLDVPLRASVSWLRTNSGTKLAGIGEGEMSVADASDIVAAVNSLPALLDEVEAMTADAERYRWLRDEAHPDAEKSGVACVELRFSDWGKPYNKHFSGDALDAAIDAARHEPTKSPQDLKDAG
jgi:hypothetical protein